MHQQLTDQVAVVDALPSGLASVETFIRRYSFFFMQANGAQLTTLAALYDAGTLRPGLDRTFPFDQTLDAMAHVEQGQANGKIVVTR